MGIKKRLTALLKERNMNTNELAQRINVTPSTIYSMLQRDSNRIDIDLIMRISRALDVTADELLSDEIAELSAQQAPAAAFQDLNEEKLVSAYRSFNALGRERLMDYVGYLESKPENLSSELFPSTKEEGDGLSSGGIA